MTVLLGIDYGRKHLGLALADSPLAQPLMTIDKAPAQALPDIIRIAAAQMVEKVVIGLPQGELDSEIKSFGDSLAQTTGLPVVYHPETLSTYEAKASLIEGGASKKKLANDHVYAACLILEDYWETEV